MNLWKDIVAVLPFSGAHGGTGIELLQDFVAPTIQREGIAGLQPGIFPEPAQGLALDAVYGPEPFPSLDFFSAASVFATHSGGAGRYDLTFRMRRATLPEEATLRIPKAGALPRLGYAHASGILSADAFRSAQGGELITDEMQVAVDADAGAAVTITGLLLLYGGRGVNAVGRGNILSGPGY